MADDQSNPANSQLAPEPRTAKIDGARLLASRMMAVVVVLAMAGTVVGVLLVNSVVTTYRDGLIVTRDGAVVAGTSAEAVVALAGNLAELTDTINDGLAATQSLLTVAITTTNDVSTALTTNVAEALEGSASIANRLASVIESIERFIPGDSDSLAEDLRTLSDGLEPVPDQLRQLGGQLGTAAESLTSTRATITALRVELGRLRDSIATAQRQLADVSALTDDLSARATAALDRSSGDAWLIRVLVIVIGLGVALAAGAARRVLVLERRP
jgi:hypothetical protein